MTLRQRIGKKRTLIVEGGIDVDLIKKEIDKEVDNHYKWKEPGLCQIILQGIKEGDSPFFGARTGKEIEDAGYTERDFVVDLFPDMVYTNGLIKKLKMYRSRLMLLLPKTCLSWHKDPSMRMHIPISGDSDSFHLIEDTQGNKVVHQIKPGFAHLMDTEVMHSGINLSKKVERLHIVGCIDVDSE